MEIESLFVDAVTLELISRDTSQSMYRALCREKGWKLAKRNDSFGYPERLRKTFHGYEVEIQHDTTFANLEFCTLKPVDSLEILEHIHRDVFADLYDVARAHNAFHWPMGVAPQASGLAPTATLSHASDTPYPEKVSRSKPGVWDGLSFISSHQVNIDVPFKEMLPRINWSYLHLGEFLEKTANSPLVVGDYLWKEGRYYYWNTFPPHAKHEFYRPLLPKFPATPYTNWQDYITRIWQSGYAYMYRRGTFWLKVPEAGTVGECVTKGKMTVRDHKTIEEKTLTARDLKRLFYYNSTDMKPHFRFKAFTPKQFSNAYTEGKMDEFMKQHVDLSYLEYRCFPPILDAHATTIPRLLFGWMKQYPLTTSLPTKQQWAAARRRFIDAVVTHKDGKPVTLKEAAALQIIHV